MIANPGIDELASRIRERSFGHPSQGPYILFLGEGCAAAAGAPSRVEVARRALRMLGSENESTQRDALPVDEVFRRFGQSAARLSSAQMPRMLRALYSGVAVPAFYQYVAMLVRERYFPLIMTMNFDTLLEQALADAGLRNSDYRLTTIGPQRTSTGAESESVPPLTHIVKLHGDLAQDMAQISPDQIQEALNASRSWIKADLRGDLVMVAHAQGDDPIDQWLSNTPQRELWWVSESPPSDRAIAQSWSHVPINEIGAEMGRPQLFFPQLAYRLLQTAIPEIDIATERPAIANAASDSLADTLRNEILRSQSVLFDLEQQSAAGERSPRLQAQISYEKRRTYGLEDRIRSLPEVRLNVRDAVNKIAVKIRSHGPGFLDQSTVKDMTRFVESLSTELSKDSPNPLLVSATLGAVLALSDRLATEYGGKVIDANDVKNLASLAPSAAGKVVL